MTTGQDLLEKFSARQNADTFWQEHWQGTFAEYLDIVRENPGVVRTAHQRMYDMITSYGDYSVDEGRRGGLKRYAFFDDPDNGGAMRFSASPKNWHNSSLSFAVRLSNTAANAGSCYCTAQWGVRNRPLPDC